MFSRQLLRGQRPWRPAELLDIYDDDDVRAKVDACCDSCSRTLDSSPQALASYYEAKQAYYEAKIDGLLSQECDPLALVHYPVLSCASSIVG